MTTIQIGDRIRDIEDGDCYFEGIVTSINPLQYEVTAVRWCEDNDDPNDPMIGEVTAPRWYWLVRFENGKWVDITDQRLTTDPSP